MHRYRSNLALLWLSWSGILCLFLTWRAVDRDGSVVTTLTWLTPHVVPTLSLVGGVAIVTRAEPEARYDPHARAAYVRALLASGLYLFVVSAAPVSVVLTLGSAEETLKPFGLILGLLQGATAAALGVFFAKSPAAS